jgi:hypothetical protein
LLEKKRRGATASIFQDEIIFVGIEMPDDATDVHLAEIGRDVFGKQRGKHECPLLDYADYALSYLAQQKTRSAKITVFVVPTCGSRASTYVIQVS